MTQGIDADSYGWDRIFLDLSSKMAEPFCALWHLSYRVTARLDPQKFENCETKTSEIAVRILIVFGATFSAFFLCVTPVPILSTVFILGAGSKILRAIGFALQKGGYTHVRGEAPEKILDAADLQLKIASWNVCGVGGGLSLDHGGVVHWRQRMDTIVQKIKEEGADVLVLQEIYDTAFAEALVERLKTEYAHFFMHLGANVLGSVGGCMVLSKCAIHRFSHESFANNDWTLNRGFETLEVKASSQEALPCARIIGTHLIHGSEPKDQQSRLEQVAQIVHSVAKSTLAMATFVVGDFNVERDGKEGQALSPYFRHGYLGPEPTCTERLVAQWDPKLARCLDETIDYISLLKKQVSSEMTLPVNEEGITLEHCHLIRAFDKKTYNTKTAASDHHGISLVAKGLQMAQPWQRTVRP